MQLIKMLFTAKRLYKEHSPSCSPDQVSDELCLQNTAEQWGKLCPGCAHLRGADQSEAWHRLCVFLNTRAGQCEPRPVRAHLKLLLFPCTQNITVRDRNDRHTVSTFCGKRQRPPLLQRGHKTPRMTLAEHQRSRRLQSWTRLCTT